MSVRAKSLARDVDVDQYLDVNGVLYFWDKIKAYVDTHVPEGGADPNLAYGCLLVAHNWTTAPTVGETQVVSASYIVGRYPEKNSQILALIRLVNTDRPIYVACYEVAEVPENPTVNSTYTMKCVNLLHVNEVVWNDISGVPTDLVYDNDLTEALNDYPTKYETTQAIDQALVPYATTEAVTTAINSAVSSVYRYAGSVSTYSNLPTTGLTVGDVYNVTDTDMNYAWVATESGGYWDPLGSTFSIEPIPNSVIQEIVDGTYGSEVV